MDEQGVKQRVTAYIDGYNLYYGRQAAFGNRYKWLNLQALCESFLRPGMELVSVKYFTAITKSITDAKLRQEIYLTALQAHCDRLEIFYGWFVSKSRQCRTCGAKHNTYEEKKTDVNIACEILNDTHLDRYDCCYLVSGDSDLVPPLKIIKENHPDKHVLVAYPPHRKSAELCGIADGWFRINERRLKKSQLPEKIVSADNRDLIRPPEWQ